MPFILRVRHHAVCLFIFCKSIDIAFLFLIKRTIICMTQSYTQLASCGTVECHGAFIVYPSRIYLPPFFKNRTNISTVDCLTKGTLQSNLACQCKTQNAVGAFVIAYGHVNISQTIERYHTIFSKHISSVTTSITNPQRSIMVTGSQIIHIKSAIISSDIVECLHYFQCISEFF